MTMDRRTIWKLVLSAPVMAHSVPVGADVLCAGADPASGQPALWIEVDPNATHEPRTFVVIGTGHIVEPGTTYRGTVIGNPFVWHIYER